MYFIRNGFGYKFTNKQHSISFVSSMIEGDGWCGCAEDVDREVIQLLAIYGENCNKNFRKLNIHFAIIFGTISYHFVLNVISCNKTTFLFIRFKCRNSNSKANNFDNYFIMRLKKRN